MSSKSDGEEDTHTQYWNPTEDAQRAPLSHFKSPRSITPKGPLFPNLGEAHQAITSRLVSRSTANQPPAAHIEPVPSSSSTSFANVSSSSDLAIGKPDPPSRQRYLTPCSASASTGADSAKTPTDPSPVVSGLESSSASNSAGDRLNQGAKADPAGLPVSKAGNSMEDIYSYYHKPSPGTEPSEILSNCQSRAASGAHSDSSHQHNPKERLSRATSKEPRLSLHEPVHSSDNESYSTQKPFDGVQNFSRPVLSPQSVSHPHDWIAVSSNPGEVSIVDSTSINLAARNYSAISQSTASPVASDVVVYGRIPPYSCTGSLHDRGYGEAKESHGETSDDLSSDSDEDPFKYDRDSFTIFLQPSREREVSAALRCVSADSAASISGISRHTPSQRPNNTPRVGHIANPFANRLQCYQTSIVDYDWESGDASNEVKISVRPPTAPPNSPVEAASGVRDHVEGAGSGHDRRNVNTLISDGADWETVATSLGQFDSNRALASSSGLSGSHLVKVTGSSIADYSDTSSIHVPHFDAFSSTERILPQQASENMRNTSHSRALNGPGRPVFLPKPRIHRVNGYLQNSRRMFTDTTTGSSANPSRNALVEKLSASIRSRSARKRAQQLQRRSNEQWPKSRFESLESLSSTYSEPPSVTDSAPMASSACEGGSTLVPVNENAGGIVMVRRGKEGRQTQESKRGTLASPLTGEPSTAHAKDKQPTDSSHSPRSFDSPTLFSFPLISLQEAASRAANRSQNDDDRTVTSKGRTHKNSSMVSSKANQKTAPPTPQVTEPMHAHTRRPTSASILGIRVTHQDSPVHSQDRIALGCNRVSSYRSGSPLSCRRSALSRTFDPMADSTSQQSIFPGGQQSVFRTRPRLIARDQRNTSRSATVMRTMTADLHRIATATETSRGHTGTNISLRSGHYPLPCRGTVVDDYFFPTDSVNEEAYLSWEARRRRRVCYYAMCVLSAFPFFAPLVYRGTFDSALSWYTRGETGSLTRRQRRNVLVVGVVFAGLWLVVLAVFVTIVVNRRVG
ncbi:uncharacterized protein P884DRAFT_192855 [Thermothelomyces heterothallicus CBS 202.75]|uniref:uncharacterized protein n=1 Tax=Thermothelomyces heterothallicus CBS 202.75 TaxID=1149848 RepID=UPI0037425722